MNVITHDEFIEKAKFYVSEKTNQLVGGKLTSASDIYVVWSCKTLQNSKALLSSHLSDGLYFEATMNGDRGEIYYDVYKKISNETVGVGVGEHGKL